MTIWVHAETDERADSNIIIGSEFESRVHVVLTTRVLHGLKLAQYFPHNKHFPDYFL